MATLYRDPYMRLRELAGLTERPDTSTVAAPEELEREQRRAEYGQRSDFGNALRQGVEDIRSSGYAARGLARTLIGGEGAGEEDLRRAQQITQDAEEFGPEVTSYEQVHDLGSAGQYALNSLGRLTPQIALALGTGGTGGLVEGGVATGARMGLRRLAANRARGIAERTAIRRAERAGAGEAVVTRALQDKAQRRVAAQLPPPANFAEAFKRGSERAVLANAVVQQSALAPDVILDPEGEGSARERALVALGGAAATGALDALPVMHLLRRYGLNGGLAEQVEGGVLKRVAKHAAKQGAEEGLTEAAQSFGERLTHKIINDNVELLGPEAMADYINSAAAGFLGGGVFGAPGGLRGSGRESAQGKRWADSFREYMGRYQRPPNAPEGPAGGAPEPALDLGAVVDRVKQAGGAAAAKIDKAARDVSARADELTRRFMAEDAVEHSIGDILDAQPFGARAVGTGEMLSEGNGVESVKRFVDGGRVQALRAAGLPMREAVAAAFLPDAALTPEFRQSGALGEAAKALAGADPKDLDDAKISAFQAALPENARNAFNRAASTVWAMQGKDVELAPEDKAAAAPSAQLQREQGMDEEQPLHNSDALIAAWRRNGKQDAKENALIFVDEKGQRRSLEGRELGRMLIERGREDPEFRAQPRAAQLAELIGDFQRRKFTLDPDSVKALELAKGQFFTAQEATALRNGLREDTARRDGTTKREDGTPRFALRQQTTTPTSARTKTERERREAAAEPGMNAEIADRAGKEDPNQRDAERHQLQPLEAGTPQTTPRVSGDAPAATRERAVAKAEREQALAQDQLDRLIATALEGEPTTTGAITAENRRALFARAMNSRLGRRNAELRARLEQAGQRYAEARSAHEAAVAKPKDAPKETPARLREGQTEDAGKVDRGALKAERKRFAPDDFNDLDRLLGRYTGEKVNGDFERRRALFKQAMADKRIGPRGKAELRDAAERYGEAQRAKALRKVQLLTDKWQAAFRRQNEHPSVDNNAALKTAYNALKKARRQYNAATKSVERTSGEAPRTGVSRAGSPAETARLQKRIEDDAARAGGSQKAIAAQIETRDGKPFVQMPDAVENSVTSQQIHEQLGREGIAAAHDSPHRFDGRFNWREHAYKGEGAMVFGAGTYLSTSNGVHQSYKRQFTAQINGFDDAELASIQSSLQSEMAKHDDLVAQLKALGAKPEDAVVVQTYTFDPNSFGGWDLHTTVVADEATAAKTLSDNVDALKAQFAALGMDADQLIASRPARPYSSGRWQARPYSEMLHRLETSIDYLQDELHSYTEGAKISPTYHVTVEAKPGEIMDWDKPLKEQPEILQKLRDAPSEPRTDHALAHLRWKQDAKGVWRAVEESDFMGDPLGDEHWRIEQRADGKFEVINETRDTSAGTFDTLEKAKTAESVSRTSPILAIQQGALHGDRYDSPTPLSRQTGEGVYRKLVRYFEGDQAKVSDYLQSLGIVGHKFAANGGRNDAHPNYVIYDDARIITNAVEFDVRASQEAVLDQLAGAVESRSRRELYALKNKVLASSMSEPTKLALLEQLDAQLAALRQAIGAAGVAELSYNDRRDVTGAHFDAVRNAVKSESSLEGALRALLGVKGVREDLRALAQALLASGAVRGIGFETVQSDRAPSGTVDGEHIAGMATGRTLNSRVRLKFATGAAPASVDPAATLLHEAIHAATSHAEQTNAAARAELQGLLDHVRREAKKLGYDPDAFYGLSETQEFLAEAFTNADLQNLLRKIKMPGEKRSAWDAFADFVAKVLGIERTALDAALDIGTRLASETAAARNAQYEAIFGESVEHSIHALTTTAAAGSAPTDYMALLAPRERRYLEATFRRAEVRRQIAAVLTPEQRAVLASADEGPRLLVNTGIGLALAGRLDLSYRADTFKGALQGLWEIISKVLQLPSKAAYGRAILGALKEGKAPGAIDAQALLLKPAALRVTRYLQANVTPKARALLRDMDGRMRSTGVPALTQLATLIAQRTGEFRADGAQSFTARQLAERNQRLNAAYSVIGDWDDKTKQRVLAELQQHKAEVSPEAAKLRAFFKDMYEYLRAAGLPVGQTEHYFPVQVSGEAIAARPEEFKALLDNFSETIRKREIKFAQGRIRAVTEAVKARGDTALTAEELARVKKLRATIKKLQNATPRELSERVFQVASLRTADTHIADLTMADGEHDPSFRPLNARMMDYIFKEGTPEQIAQFASFQDQNLDRIVVQYVNRATRRAEWTRLNMGGQIKALLAQAQQEGATAADLDTAKDYIDMAMGTYGNDWNPFVKRLADNLGFTLPSFEKYDKLQTALTAYQNLRLLPLAAMSSLIDPLGVAVRSGELAGAFTAYKQAATALRDKHGNDALRALAQDMGLIERHAVGEALTHLYGTANDPTGRAAKINALLFRFNGLEAITKFSRLAALAAGNSFLKFHAASGSEQSARYLTELGLKKSDIVVGADGFIVRNDKVDAALTRFVHEAVVRPTTGQRPGWQNDPNFRLAAQYKGYLYSFFNTITRRALHELDHGNAAVLLPLLLYLPVTAMGELLRDLFQRDGKNKDAVDYAKQAVTRSGLLGPQISVVADGRADLTHGHFILNSLGGPTGQQLGKAYDALTRSGAGKVAEEALPASTLYKDWN